MRPSHSAKSPSLLEGGAGDEQAFSFRAGLDTSPRKKGNIERSELGIGCVDFLCAMLRSRLQNLYSPING